METKALAAILSSQGVTVAYATPTPRIPRNQWACVDADPDLFFPADDYSLAAAQRICATCPVRETCLGLGQARAETGVWGGVLLDRGKTLQSVPVLGRPRKTKVAAA